MVPGSYFGTCFRGVKMVAKNQRQIKSQQQKEIAYQRAYRRTSAFLAGFVTPIAARMIKGKRKGK